MADMIEEDGPINIVIGGEIKNIPKLKIGDYLPWLDELHGQMRANAAKCVRPNTTPQQMMALLTQVEMNPPTPDDLMYFAYTAKGQIRIAEMAMKKAGITDPKPAIDYLSASDLKEFAIRVSGLFNRKQLLTIFHPEIAAAEQQAKADQPATFGDGRMGDGQPANGNGGLAKAADPFAAVAANQPTTF